MNLNNFKTLKAPLLKEWNEKQFERFTNEGLYLIKVNFADNIKFTAGSRPEYGQTTRYLNNESIENLFGLPYTSSSEFAAIWNTNTQAETKHGKQLYFVCFAVNENEEGVLIFKDAKENYFYFNNYDFMAYQKSEQEKDRAKQIAQFTKDTNQATQIAINILKEFAGKPYGEKTREKIYTLLKEQTKQFDFNSIYLSNGDCLHIQKVVAGGDTVRNSIYFKHLNKENKIELLSTPEQIKEFDGLEVLHQCEKLKGKIQTLSKSLYNEVETFNHLQRLLHKETNETQIFNYQLSTVAKYGVRD